MICTIDLSSRVVLIALLALLMTGLLLLLRPVRRGNHHQAGLLHNRSDSVDRLLQPFDSGRRPGAAVLVVQHGRVVHARGYGLANLASELPIDPNTSFELASVSKQFTAIAVMLLAERKGLSYDTRLSTLLPEFSRFAPAVTVRHLLHHTSGLPDYLDLTTADNGWSTPRIIALLAARPPLFGPGERFDYSNSNYLLLARIVELVAGERFPAFMHRHVFQPLKMNRSLIYDATRPTITNQALAYRDSPEATGGFEEIATSDLDQLYGDGSVRSTLLDLAKWDRALRSGSVVSKATLQQAYASGKLNDGTTTGYGFGWSVDRATGRVDHSGNWAGYNCQFSRYFKQDLTVVVLSNADDLDASEIAYQVATLYLSPDNAD